MIYLNFIHAPSGGGLQNSVSFLQTLVDNETELEDFCCFVFSNSILEAICKKYSIKHESIHGGIISKMAFELFFFSKIKKNDVVFSIFGPPLLFTEGKSTNIGGMAISNVFYPDVQFWGYLSPLKRFLKIFKDKYRIYRYKKLDHWIFETELLADLAINKFNFPKERVSVVKMAPSALVSLDKVTNKNIFDLPCQKIKVLMLCGAHPNKRHHLLPKLAKELKKSCINNVLFVFTASPNEYLESVFSTISDLNVEEYFYNIGPVEPDNVANLISSVDFVMNVSLLESFSNNFVEAWAMQKPLITVFDEWARSAAKNAALYIDIKNEEIITDTFLTVLKADKEQVVKNGNLILSEHPTAEQKNMLYMNVIKKAKDLGVLEKSLRKGITLK